MQILALLIKYKNFAITSIILLCVCLGGVYVNHLQTENKTLLAENTVLTAKLEISNASINALQVSINEQNTAIDKLKSAADARVKAHAAEIAAAHATAEAYKKKASDIMRSLPSDANKCTAANDLINQEILKNVKK
jgi:hypothetical protein